MKKLYIAIVIAMAGVYFWLEASNPARNKPWDVKVDFRLPSSLHVIPEPKWHEHLYQEGRAFCAPQGRVAAEIITPDGIIVKDLFRIAYIDRDSDGIFKIHAVARDGLLRDEAVTRFEQEIRKWGSGYLSEQAIQSSLAHLHFWLTNEARSLHQGFEIKRGDYNFSFGFTAASNPDMKKIVYFYEIAVGEPAYDKKERAPGKGHQASEGKKTEPNKAMQPTPVDVTDHADACSAPSTSAADL